MVAADIDSATVSRLRRRHPAWSISRCDFTDGHSRARAQAVRGGQGGFDVIALNPPFSFRGGTKRDVQIGDRATTCSPPLAFVAEAVRYLRSGGQLVAILPHGALTSEERPRRPCAPGRRPRVRGRAHVRAGDVFVVHSKDRGRPNWYGYRFRGPSSSCFSDSRRPFPGWRRQYAAGPDTCRQGHAYRAPTGTHDGSNRRGSGPPAPVRQPGWREDTWACRSAPASGKADGGEGGPYGGHQPSGGAIRLRARPVECSTPSAARTLQRAIVENWKTVEAAYGGTCARYLTLASLQSFLWALGVAVLPYGDSIRARTSLSGSGDGLASEEPELRAVLEREANGGVIVRTSAGGISWSARITPVLRPTTCLGRPRPGTRRRSRPGAGGLRHSARSSGAGPRPGRSSSPQSKFRGACRRGTRGPSRAGRARAGVPSPTSR